MEFLTINISFIQIKWLSQYASYITDYYKKYNKLKKSMLHSSSPSTSDVPQLLSPTLTEESEKPQNQDQGWFSYLGSYIESFLPGDDTNPPAATPASASTPKSSATPSFSPSLIPSHYETNLTIICVEIEKFTIILHEDKIDRIRNILYLL